MSHEPNLLHKAGVDREAEGAVLGAALLYPSVVRELRGDLKAEHFDPLSPYPAVWQAMLDCHAEGESVDAVSVAQRLERSSKAKGLWLDIWPQPIGVISDLLGRSMGPGAVGSYAERVRQGHLRRIAVDAASEVIRASNDADHDALIEALGRCGALVQGGKRFETVTIAQAAAEEATLLREIEMGASGKPWRVGLSLIDRDINPAYGGGIMRGQFGVVAGRAKAGKSTFAMDLSRRLLDRHEEMRLHVTSLELRARRLAAKVMRSVVGRMRCGSDGGAVSVAEMERASELVGEHYGDRCTITARPGMGPDDVFGDWLRAVDKGASVLVLDHMHRVRYPGRRSDLRLHIGDFCERMASFAEREDVAIVAAAQLSRAAESDPNGPSMHHLGESTAIEQHVDWALALWPASKSQIEVMGDKVVNAKHLANRDGPVAREVLDVSWKYQAFSDRGT